MGYALYFFGQVFRNDSPGSTTGKAGSPVSVIICARNEAANLQKNLPAILSQRYENEAGKRMYEVIVVNDASTDDTAKVLDELGRANASLQVVTIPQNAERNLPGKKFALGKGVAAANHELLLLTDADCIPASEYWLEKMILPLAGGKQVVAGVGKFFPAKGLLNAFVRWETLHTFLQYSTYTSADRPYMAVGRNMACTKAAFMHAQQSDAWAKLPSGDDDLLVNAVADSNNAFFVADPATFTYSPAKEDWQSWIKQKQRHLSTGKYYKPAIILLLGIYACSHALMWLTFFMLLLTSNWLLALGVMACRCVVYWMIWAEAAHKLHEKRLTRFFPLADIGWMIYNFAFSPYIFFKNKQSWK